MLNILEKKGRAGAVCRCVICKDKYEVNDRFYSDKQRAGNQCSGCKNFHRNPPTQLSLLKTYNYCMYTGHLTYKRDFNFFNFGEIATTSHTAGYLTVQLDKPYLAHRIVWLMQTGEWPDVIDHINHVRTDNSWANLRDVAVHDNHYNKSINTNNTSGYLGVSYMKALKKYRAYVTVDRKSIHLGLFNTPEEAHQARLAANDKHGYHLNHGVS